MVNVASVAARKIFATKTLFHVWLHADGGCLEMELVGHLLALLEWYAVRSADTSLLKVQVEALCALAVHPCVHFTSIY